MIGTIRKHQTWLWAVIITAIIISFVWYFSPYSKFNESAGSANYGSINGEKITAEDYTKSLHEVYLQYFFRSGGNWPSDEARQMGFDPERETYQWMLLAQKQRQLGIHISAEVAAQTARGMLSQFQKQEFTPQVFLQRVLQPKGLNFEDFDRFVRHYLGIQELIATVGGGGKLVTPQDIKAIYIREHEELAAEAAFFSATNYWTGVTVTPEAVTQYYTSDTNKYQIPDRVQVSYVKFDFTNFVADATLELAKMTNLDQEIDAAYRQNPTNLLKEVKAQTLEEAKVKIRESRLKAFEAQFAHRKAAQFATILFEMAPMRAQNLQELAKTNGQTVKVTAPFDRDEGPKDIEVGEDFAKAAFALTPIDPFASPLVGQDAAYVIAYNKQIPSEIPPLDKIREKVTDDYKQSQALSKARQEGSAFSLKVTTGLAQGKTFDAIGEEAKVKPVKLPPFSLSTRQLPEATEHLTLDQLKQLAFSTQPGKASNFQATSEGGVILFVKSKSPPDENKMNSDLPAFAQNLRLSRQQESFNIWFSREAEKGLRDTPLAQRKQAPNMSRQRKS